MFRKRRREAEGDDQGGSARARSRRPKRVRLEPSGGDDTSTGSIGFVLPSLQLPSSGSVTNLLGFVKPLWLAARWMGGWMGLTKGDGSYGAGWTDLPEEIQLVVLAKVPLRQLAKKASTCKLFLTAYKDRLKERKVCVEERLGIGRITDCRFSIHCAMLLEHCLLNLALERSQEIGYLGEMRWLDGLCDNEREYTPEEKRQDLAWALSTWALPCPSPWDDAKQDLTFVAEARVTLAWMQDMTMLMAPEDLDVPYDLIDIPPIPEHLQCWPEHNSCRVTVYAEEVGTMRGMYRGFSWMGRPDGLGQWVGFLGHSRVGKWRGGKPWED